MRFQSRWALIALCSVFFTGLALSSVADAEDPPPRRKWTGRYMFERQWEWTGPAAPQPAPVDAAQLFSPNELVTTAELEKRLAAIESSRPTTRRHALGDGLGPLHNATSCAECHVAGGGSGVQHNVTLITIDPRSEGLTQTKEGGQRLLELFPGVLGVGGTLAFNTLVHDRSTRDGYTEIRNGLASHVPNGIDDTWFIPEQRKSAAIAEDPVIAGRYDSIDYYLSQRNSPALFGIGAIETISLHRLRNVAKKQATKTKGEITGRVAGRFGWRGQVDSLLQFVTGACGSELGLNTATAPQANDPADPNYVNLAQDMTQTEVRQVMMYVQSIPRPVEIPPDGYTTSDCLDGETLFNSAGCVTCHAADVHPVSGMFSDLLLHDMGPDLQAAFPAPLGELQTRNMLTARRFSVATQSAPSSSSIYYGSQQRTVPPAPYAIPRPEQPQFPRGEVPESVFTEDSVPTWDALQREWKTPPLWGVADTAPYLHDGRAETLEEAILWHGGEANSSRDHYEKLSRADKDLLLVFLSSLRAPDIGPPAEIK